VEPASIAAAGNQRPAGLSKFGPNRLLLGAEAGR